MKLPLDGIYYSSSGYVYFDMEDSFSLSNFDAYIF